MTSQKRETTTNPEQPIVPKDSLCKNLNLSITMKIKLLPVLAAILIATTGMAQQLNWGMQFGLASASNPGSKMMLDDADNIYQLDLASQTMEVDPGEGEYWIDAEEMSNWGLVLKKFNAIGEFDWAIHLPGTYAYYSAFALDELGNIVVSSSYSSCDFDPGEGDATLTSENTDIFVASYSSDGNFNWVKNIVVDDANAVYDLTTDQDGNIILAGYYSGTMDADPGLGEYLIEPFDTDIDAYIIKLNNVGELLWAHTLGGEMYDYISSISADNDGNIVVGGVHRSETDFDPSVNEYILSSATGEYESNFLAKYDADGNFLWAHTTDNIYPSVDENYVIDSENNIVVTGYYAYDVDFDSGVGELLASADFGWFICKYNASGELSWAMAPEGYVTPSSIALDAENNIFVAINAYGPTDMNPGIGMVMSGVENPTLFVMKLNPDGYYLSGFAFEDNDMDFTDWFDAIDIDSQNNVVVSGMFQGVLDIDPSSGENNLEAPINIWPSFVASISQDPCDLVATISSASDVTCATYEGSAAVEIISTGTPASVLWENGDETLETTFDSPGVYSVDISNAMCTLTFGVLISGPVSENGFDLEPNLFTWDNFIPGFESVVQLNGVNNGCLATDGTLSLELDSEVTYINADPAPDLVNGNILTWNFSQLGYDSEALAPIVTVLTSETTELGETIDLVLTMLPAEGDVDADNNVKNYAYTVVGSYDPNDKQVSPQGTGDQGMIAGNQEMTYTIRFQNTGTYPATNVVITDIIDSNLDLNSMQIVDASHPMITEVFDNNEVHFVFNDIMLPDSTNNEPESHGYVIYKIQQNEDLVVGTELENTANIFFDFNAPVITNTTLNTIAGPDYISQNETEMFSAFPNPADQMLQVMIPQGLLLPAIRLTDVTGKVVLRQTAFTGKNQILTNEIARGTYQLEVVSGNKKFAPMKVVIR